MSNFCDQSVFVKEALIANPHKYGEAQKQELREHTASCKTCIKVIDEAREFADDMGYETEY